MAASDTDVLRSGDKVILDTDLRSVGLHGAADAGHLTKVTPSTRTGAGEDVYLFKIVSSTIDDDGVYVTIRPFGRERTFRVRSDQVRRASEVS